MKNHYTKELLITSTYSDRFCELGLTQATLLLQDAMTELFYTNPKAVIENDDIDI